MPALGPACESGEGVVRLRRVTARDPDQVLSPILKIRVSGVFVDGPNQLL